MIIANLLSKFFNKTTPLQRNLALVFVVIASITGGSNSAVAKYLLDVFHPFTIILMRFSFATLFLLPFVWQKRELSLKNFQFLFQVSVIGALNPILLFIALQFTKASFSPLIYAGVPALTAIYMSGIEGIKISRVQIMGIILGLSGVCITILLPLLQKNTASISFFGNFLIFLASLAFLTFGIRSRKIQKEHNISPLALTFYFSLMSLIIAIPFSAWEVLKFGISPEINFIHILLGVWAGVIATGVFYMSYQFALKHGTAVTASLFTYLQPITGIALAVIFLGEMITLPFVIGGALALLGAGLASRK